MLAHVGRQRISEAEEISAAMVIDDAFRVAGRARGVIERDGVPLVVRHLPGEFGIAARDEILVFRFGSRDPRPGKAGSM